MVDNEHMYICVVLTLITDNILKVDKWQSIALQMIINFLEPCSLHL
jgi:hypothetical protein